MIERYAADCIPLDVRGAVDILLKLSCKFIRMTSLLLTRFEEQKGGLKLCGRDITTQAGSIEM